jgi:hypothetical protein
VDRLKGIMGKIDLLINRIKGNVVTLFADKFPEGADSLSIAQDLANGLLTLEGVDIDDMNPSEKRNFLFKVENIGVDYNSYRALNDERFRIETQIKEIFSIPSVALGQQQSVIGKSVQEQSISQASYGVKPLYDGFAQYLNNIVHAACEMRKNLILLSDGSEEELEVLKLTDRDYQTFKVSKDWSLSRLSIYLDSKDVISEQDRAALLMLFERELQVQGGYVDALTVAEARACKTNTQLRNLLAYKKKVWEAKQAELAAQQQQQQMAMANINANAQEEISREQTRGKLANTSLKVEGELEKAALQKDMDS